MSFFIGVCDAVVKLVELRNKIWLRWLIRDCMFFSELKVIKTLLTTSTRLRNVLYSKSRTSLFLSDFDDIRGPGVEREINF